jgi:hypothetical protein
MPNTAVSVREPRFGAAVFTSGEKDINYTRAVVSEHGYQAAITVKVNYNTVDRLDIRAIEDAVLSTIRQMFAQAAAQRDRNKPLFSI